MHPVLDATASVTAAADTRDGRFRIQKLKHLVVRLQQTMAARTETEGAVPKGRATFTPETLASMVSSSRERGQKNVREYPAIESLTIARACEGLGYVVHLGRGEGHACNQDVVEGLVPQLPLREYDRVLRCIMRAFFYCAL